MTQREEERALRHKYAQNSSVEDAPSRPQMSAAAPANTAPASAAQSPPGTTMALTPAAAADLMKDRAYMETLAKSRSWAPRPRIRKPDSERPSAPSVKRPKKKSSEPDVQENPLWASIRRGDQEAVLDVLREGKFNSNMSDPKDKDNYPIHMAIQNDDQVILRTLLRFNARRTAKNSFGHCPMHSAIIYDAYRCLRHLIGLPSVAVEPYDKTYNETMFETARRAGAKKCIDVLREFLGEEKRDYWGYVYGEYDKDGDFMTAKSAFHFRAGVLNGALMTDDATLLEECVSKSPELLDIMDSLGRTPIAAAVYNGKVDCVKALVKLCKKLDWVDPSRKGGLLHLAVLSERPSCIEALVNAGLDVNQKNDRGDTPLSLACGNVSMSHKALELLDRRADPFLANYDGENAVFACCAVDNHKVLARIIEMNKDKKDKLAVMSFRHETALHTATRSKSVKCAELLAQLRIEILLRSGNVHGHTPLHLCALLDLADVAKTMMECGANAKQLCRRKDTPFHIAVENDNPSALRAMLRLCRGGTSVVNGGAQHETVMECAIANGRAKCVNVCLEAGFETSFEKNPLFKKLSGLTGNATKLNVMPVLRHVISQYYWFHQPRRVVYTIARRRRALTLAADATVVTSEQAGVLNDALCGTFSALPHEVIIRIAKFVHPVNRYDVPGWESVVGIVRLSYLVAKGRFLDARAQQT